MDPIAAKTAELLLQIKAILLQPQNPFTWSSGWISPIYCDNRKALSYPTARSHIRDEFSNKIKEKYGSIENYFAAQEKEKYDKFPQWKKDWYEEMK